MSDGEVFTSMKQVRKRFFPNSLPPGRVKCPACGGKKGKGLGAFTCQTCDGKGHIACPHCSGSTPRFEPEAAGDQTKPDRAESITRKGVVRDAG